MQIKQGDILRIADTEEKIETEARVLAAVSLDQQLYFMIVLAEDEEQEALILKLRQEPSEYQIQKEDGEVLGYGAELDELEWNRAADTLEKAGEYILNPQDESAEKKEGFE